MKGCDFFGYKKYKYASRWGSFERFKNCCKNDYGVSLAIVTEALMKDFCDGGYDVIISKNGTSLRRHEDENDKKAN